MNELMVTITFSSGIQTKASEKIIVESQGGGQLYGNFRWHVLR
jgi:hypothetical protein